jgi:hypothetical protein
MKYVYARRRSSTSTASDFRFRAITCAQEIRLRAYRRVVDVAIEVRTLCASCVKVTSSSSQLRSYRKIRSVYMVENRNRPDLNDLLNVLLGVRLSTDDEDTVEQVHGKSVWASELCSSYT